MLLDVATNRRHLHESRIGVLGTVGADGRPHLVPVVFAIDRDELLVPVDTVKAKQTTRLRRLENLERTPQASLLIDHRSEDWGELWWVRADLRYVGAEPADRAAALRDKYEQYREAGTIAEVLRFRIDRLTGWSAR